MRVSGYLGRSMLGVISFLVAVLAFAGSAQAADGDVGSEVCATCHEEVARDFALTSHAIAPGWGSDVNCESCHGPGQAHVESGGEPDQIVQLSVLPPRDASETCLTCHARQRKQFTASHSTHQLSDISCIDCHNPHSTAERLLEKSGVELCSQCHQSTVSQFDMPRAHPLAGYPHIGKGEDRGCAACHEPHTTSPLRRNRGMGDSTCVSCHSEKAGPFVYSHDVALVDGCASCHQIHGSPNRHLLTHSRQVNLCYQCHPGTTTPGFHSAPGFLTEKCASCHTAIHGSNTHPFFLEE